MQPITDLGLWSHAPSCMHGAGGLGVDFAEEMDSEYKGLLLAGSPRLHLACSSLMPRPRVL